RSSPTPRRSSGPATRSRFFRPSLADNPRRQETSMSRISVQTEDFDVATEIAGLTAGRTDIGGLGCFIGIVRDEKPDASPEAAIRALTLEHYPAMTLRAIGRITEEAERRWSL